jgi:hypothetical protein
MLYDEPLFEKFDEVRLDLNVTKGLHLTDRNQNDIFSTILMLKPNIIFHRNLSNVFGDETYCQIYGKTRPRHSCYKYTSCKESIK